MPIDRHLAKFANPQIVLRRRLLAAKILSLDDVGEVADRWESMTKQRRQFDAKNWFSEGDGLLASAAKTRETWTDHRRAFSQTVRKRGSEKLDRASDSGF